jgi:hypothetical protein
MYTFIYQYLRIQIITNIMLIIILQVRITVLSPHAKK